MTHEEMRELVERIGRHHPHLYPLFSHEFGDAVVGIESGDLVQTALDLKDAGFDRLTMVTAVDRDDVFVLVYRLQSRSLSAAIFLKTKVSRESARVDSVCEIWPAANWQEREVFDLFGIDFTGHPDLRRILMPYDYVEHPLRKDFDSPELIRRPDYL